MADTYTTRGVVSQSDPAIGILAIDFSSDQTISGNARGLHISTAGTLNVIMADGSTGALVLAVGVYPYRVTKILNSGSSNAVGFILF